MSDENDNDFDLDAGVADIASDMGFTSDSDDIIEDEDSELLDNKEEDEAIAEEVKEPENTIELKPAPSSWAKDQHENWAKVPKEAQEYIELREKQMLDGIEQYKAGNQFGHEIAKVIEPYRDVLQRDGVNEAQAIKALFDHHRALTEGSLEQRQQALLHIGYMSGIIPREGQQSVDPLALQLQQRVQQIERQEQQRQQAAMQKEQESLAKMVDDFSKDPAHPYFEELSDDIVQLLSVGNDLKSAYEKAVWANPITRAKELSRAQAEQLKVVNDKATKEALSAKKAVSNNVRSANTKRSAPSSSLGSWDDTMAEVMSAMRNN